MVDGNYGIALLRLGRNAEAVSIFGQAGDLFASRNLKAQVQQVDSLIGQAVNALLESLPEAVRTAIQQGNGDALDAALGALPPEEAAAIAAQLRVAGILGGDQRAEDETE